MAINFKSDVAKEVGGSGDLSPIKEDRFNVIVEKVERSAPPKNYLKIQMSILNGFSTDKEFKNRKLWTNLQLEGKGQVFLYRFLEAVGSELINKDSVEDSEIITDLLNRKLSVWAVPTKTQAGNDSAECSKFQKVIGESDSFEVDEKDEAGTPSDNPNELFK